MKREGVSYHPLIPHSPRGSLTGEGSLAPDQDAYGDTHQTRKSRAWVFHACLGAGVLFLMALSSFITTIILKPSDRQCVERLSLYSPAFEAIEYVEYDFENSFNSTTIYRGPPTPEREEAWQQLSQRDFIEVPEDRISDLNRSKEDNMLHVPSEAGTGYLALTEVFHQLHCLNLIRMYTWLQAGKYETPPGGLTSTPVGNRMHVDHCIETLRITLMCHGDVTPILVLSDPTAPLGARADFNTHHKCRNFDKISDWITEHKAVSLAI
ncbi:hypothetical protein GQ53DRAFT_855067 [Thozetella sp. PMI_491]|nr:hypothetical protein GQ53DRAFT_855067 [Thozetella sp. PMI_491]